MSIEYILIWMVLMFVIKELTWDSFAKRLFHILDTTFHWNLNLQDLSDFTAAYTTHCKVLEIIHLWDWDLRLVSRNPGIMSVREMWHFVQPSVTRYYQPGDNVMRSEERGRQHAHTQLTPTPIRSTDMCGF